MLTDVLLSIKPVHLANIVSRQKNHEYRKYRLRDEATRLWFYETSEGGQGRAAVTYVFDYVYSATYLSIVSCHLFLLSILDIYSPYSFLVPFSLHIFTQY